MYLNDQTVDALVIVHIHFYGNGTSNDYIESWKQEMRMK